MDTVRETSSIVEAETIVCRCVAMLGLFWTLIAVEFLVMLLTFANIFLSSGIIWSDAQFGLFMFNLCLLPLCIFTGLYVRQARVIANIEGLRWRQIGRWRRSGWENITAYYGYQQLTSSPASSTNKLGVKLQTSDGSFVLWPEEWSSSAQLLQSIKQHAREASGLGLLGPLVKKNLILPLNCRYDTAVNRNILGWLDSLHKYGLLAVAVYFAYQWFTTHTLPVWEWLLTPTGLFVIIKQTLPLVLRPMYKATQPRLGDKVVADQDPLCRRHSRRQV